MTEQTNTISAIDSTSLQKKTSRFSGGAILWNSLRTTIILGLGVTMFGWNTPWTSEVQIWDNSRMIFVGVSVYALLSIMITVVTRVNPFAKNDPSMSP